MNTVTLVRASSFYTIDDALDMAEGETLVIGGKTYTVNATLGSSDGDVHIGADIAGTVTNILAAINLSNEGESAVGAGTDYAAAMTKNPIVHGVLTSATVLTCQSLLPGVQGNLIPLTIGTSANTVDNAVLEDGAGSLDDWLAVELRSNQLNAEVMQDLKTLTVADD